MPLKIINPHLQLWEGHLKALFAMGSEMNFLLFFRDTTYWAGLRSRSRIQSQSRSESTVLAGVEIRNRIGVDKMLPTPTPAPKSDNCLSSCEVSAQWRQNDVSWSGQPTGSTYHFGPPFLCTGLVNRKCLGSWSNKCIPEVIGRSRGRIRSGVGVEFVRSESESESAKDLALQWLELRMQMFADLSEKNCRWFVGYNFSSRCLFTPGLFRKFPHCQCFARNTFTKDIRE